MSCTRQSKNLQETEPGRLFQLISISKFQVPSSDLLYLSRKFEFYVFPRIRFSITNKKIREKIEIRKVLPGCVIAIFS